MDLIATTNDDHHPVSLETWEGVNYCPTSTVTCDL
jgi:hypothetical protein